MAKVTCTTAGLTDNWIELSEVWTRDDDRALDTAGVDEALSSLRKRATACHLVMSDGVAIDSPEMLTEENLTKCDLRLWGFIIYCQYRTKEALKALGNFNVRLSSDSAGKLK